MTMKGKRNAYSCLHCGLTIITVDEDEGTTPFMLGCRASGCEGMMQSHFYRGPNVESERPAGYAWRKPSKAEYKRSSKGMKAHFDAGGLNIYPCAAAPGSGQEGK